MSNAQIARKHSFTGADFSIPGVEDRQTLDNLRADLIAVYQPVNSQELFAVERIGLAQLSLLRVARLEAGMFAAVLGDSEKAEGPEGAGAEDSTDDLSEGFCRLAGKSAIMPLFLRYQAQSERNYRRAVEEFKRLKNLRKELPNQLTEDRPEPPRPQPAAAAPIPIRPAAQPAQPPTPPVPAVPAALPLVAVASPSAATANSNHRTL
ncbi:MAG TPA: hypothetical protein VME43_30850 [Bryobacteraceae bacterium]|nr:hypothetical protein [Bryobacteraceae bacterium]